MSQNLSDGSLDPEVTKPSRRPSNSFLNILGVLAVLATLFAVWANLDRVNIVTALLVSFAIVFIVLPLLALFSFWSIFFDKDTTADEELRDEGKEGSEGIHLNRTFTSDTVVAIKILLGLVALAPFIYYSSFLGGL